MSITPDGFKREKVDIVTMVYVREIVRGSLFYNV